VATPAAPATELVVLDVNETLFPLDPVAARLADVGLAGALELWFARVLRDGIAAAAAGRLASFSDLGRHHLLELLADRDDPAATQAVTHVLAGFGDVVPHADVAPGLTALQAAGIPAVALTNGSADVTRGFLARAGLTHLVADVHDVTEAGRWKPTPDPYRWLLHARGVAPEQALMVAVHPWDLTGAQAVGMRTAWIDRSGSGRYPAVLGTPDLVATGLPGVVAQLLRTPP
jgi:2-haloacid dehalogenase